MKSSKRPAIAVPLHSLYRIGSWSAADVGVRLAWEAEVSDALRRHGMTFDLEDIERVQPGLLNEQWKFSRSATDTASRIAASKLRIC